MEQRITSATLARASCIASLPAGVLDAVAERVRPLRVPDGEQVIGHLDASRDLYIILSGEIRITLMAETGRILTYQILPPGEMFGEVAAVDGLPRTASAIAESEAVLARLAQEEFDELIDRYSEFARIILNRMARLNRRLTLRLYEYHTYDVRGRICFELLRLTETNPKAVVALTDQDMATRVGTTRANVTRIFGQLRESGLISRGGGGLTLRTRAQLLEELGRCEFQ